MRLDIITVPYRYDDHNVGIGAGPGALLKAGLAARLQKGGHEPGETTEATLTEQERAPGETLANIGRLGRRTADLVANSRIHGDGTLVIAGDDTSVVGVVAGLQRCHGAGARIGLVWLDAHGDFNTPETTMSGILAGMPVATIAGLATPRWREAAGMLAPIPTDRIMIAGARELDVREEALIRATSVQVLTGDDLREPGTYVPAVESLAAPCEMLILHLDLDLLDPDLVPSSPTPAARGLRIDEVEAVMAHVLGTGKVAVVTVAGLNPGGGTRGTRSIASALEVIEKGLAAWTQMPAQPSGL